MPPRTGSRVPARAAPALPRPRTAASKRMQEREAASKEEQLKALTKRRDELLAVVGQLGNKRPFILDHPDVQVSTEGKDFRFMSEKLSPAYRKMLNKKKQEGALGQHSRNKYGADHTFVKYFCSAP